MLLYSIIMVIGMAITITLNAFFNPLYKDKWWMYIILVVAFVVVTILIDGLVAAIIRKMPEKYFSEDKGIYKASRKELIFYKKIGVDKWKNYVPELGMFTGFSKGKVMNPNDNEYIGRFILEARYGVAIHLWSVPFSFLLLLGDYNMYTGHPNIILTIALPVAVVNAILIVLPAFILKFNLHRLVKIYESNKRMEERHKQKELEK